MRQSIDVPPVHLGLATRLQSGDDARVECAPPSERQARKRNLVREGMPERVLQLRKQSRLMEELAGLQARQPLGDRVRRCVGDRLEQRTRHVLADGGGRLQQDLLSRGKPVDAGREHGKYRRGHVRDVGQMRHVVVAARAGQCAALDEIAHAFLEEKRIPSGALGEHRLHGGQRRRGSQQPVQKSAGCST